MAWYVQTYTLKAPHLSDFKHRFVHKIHLPEINTHIIYTRTNPRTRTISHAHTYTNTQSHYHAHNHARSYTHTQSHYHAHNHARSYKHTCTQTRIRKRSQRDVVI